MKMTIEEFREWARGVMADPVRRTILLSTMDTLEKLDKQKQTKHNANKPTTTEENHTIDDWEICYWLPVSSSLDEDEHITSCNHKASFLDETCREPDIGQNEYACLHCGGRVQIQRRQP